MPVLIKQQRFAEVVGNIWSSGADLICVTTNPVIAKHGGVVMGRGSAYQAKIRFPGIDRILADQVRRFGNVVSIIWDNPAIASFPVKHHWLWNADPELIRRSAKDLVFVANNRRCKTVALPRPGCGNGLLRWEDEVKPVLVPILDERFAVYFDA